MNEQLSFPESSYKEITYADPPVCVEVPIMSRFIEYYNEHRTADMPYLPGPDEP